MTLPQKPMTVPEQMETEVPAASASSKTPKPELPNFGAGLRGWLHAGMSFPAFLTILLIGIIYFFSMYRADMNDPDIWWHMRDAQFLLQHHQFVRHDMYSFTVAGHSWVNTEWLSEIPYYLAYRAMGLAGLKSLPFVVLSATFLLLLYLCYRESKNFKASALACYFAVFLSTVSFGPRTILFGYLYLVFLLIILQRFRQRGDAPLWTVPILFCLWANTHGSWSLGVIVFFLFAIAGLLNRPWERLEVVRWTPPQRKKLALTGIASVAALFANPYGWRLVYYPFDLAFHQKLNIGHVQEWVSVNFHDGRGKLVVVLLLVLVASAFLRNKRWYLGEVLVLLFALYCGLTHIRFLMLLGIMVAPTLAKLLDFAPPYRRAADVPAVNLVLILAVLTGMVFYWPGEAKIRESIEKTYPAGVISYLQAHPPQGNVLNFYLWGGYLGWNNPQFKDFVDSRVDIFEYAGVLQDYLDILGADDFQHRPDRILDKYQIRYVLFPQPGSKNPLLASGELASVLEHDPHWKPIYQDDISVLLEKQ